MTAADVYAETLRFVADQVADHGLIRPVAITVVPDPSRHDVGPAERACIRVESAEQFGAWCAALGWAPQTVPGVLRDFHYAEAPSGTVAGLDVAVTFASSALERSTV